MNFLPGPLLLLVHIRYFGGKEHRMIAGYLCTKTTSNSPIHLRKLFIAERKAIFNNCEWCHLGFSPVVPNGNGNGYLVSYIFGNGYLVSYICKKQEVQRHFLERQILSFCMLFDNGKVINKERREKKRDINIIVSNCPHKQENLTLFCAMLCWSHSKHPKLPQRTSNILLSFHFFFYSNKRTQA